MRQVAPKRMWSAGGRVSSLVCAAWVLIASSTAAAQTDAIWTDPAGGDWQDGTKWQGGSPPTGSMPAVFSLDAMYDVRLTDDAPVGGMRVEGDDVTIDLNTNTLTLEPSAWDVFVGITPTQVSSLQFADGALRGPNAFDGASFTVGPDGHMGMTGVDGQFAEADFNVNGRMIVDGGSQVSAFGFSTATVGGRLEVRDPTTFFSPAQMDVTGDVVISGGASAGAGNSTLVLMNGSTLRVDDATAFGLSITAMGASITLENGASLRSDLDNVDLALGSTLRGDGSISGGLSNGGTVSPGLPVGLLSMDTLLMRPDGLLEIDLGGLMRGVDHDALQVVDATLAGTLSVSLAEGYEPVLGDTFDLITGSFIFGEFDMVDLPTFAGGLGFGVEYSQTAVTLTVIPSPSGIASLLVVGALAGARRRRR